MLPSRRRPRNGLALKVVGETILEWFGRSIAGYLEYAAATPGVMIAGVRELLGAHIRRLPGPERVLLRWLAIEREPVGLVEMAAAFGSRGGRCADRHPSWREACREPACRSGTMAQGS